MLPEDVRRQLSQFRSSKSWSVASTSSGGEPLDPHGESLEQPGVDSMGKSGEAGSQIQLVWELPPEGRVTEQFRYARKEYGLTALHLSGLLAATGEGGFASHGWSRLRSLSWRCVGRDSLGCDMLGVDSMESRVAETRPRGGVSHACVGVAAWRRARCSSDVVGAAGWRATTCATFRSFRFFELPT